MKVYNVNSYNVNKLSYTGNPPIADAVQAQVQQKIISKYVGYDVQLSIPEDVEKRLSPYVQKYFNFLRINWTTHVPKEQVKRPWALWTK